MMLARGILHCNLDVSGCTIGVAGPFTHFSRRAMTGIDMHLYTVTVVAVTSAVPGTVAP